MLVSRFFHVRSPLIASALIGATAAALLTPRATSAQTLTGATVFATDSSGTYSNGNDGWNTLGGDSIYNLWVSLNGTPINGPTDANAIISTSLAVPGTYNFAIFGNPGRNSAYYGLNLFFDSNNTTPGISVFAATANAVGSTPTFSADGQTTFNVAGNAAPGAGTFTFSSGGNNITLTTYRWEYSTVQNQDVVDEMVRTPGNGSDNQGSFTLRVVASAAPEPSACALLLTGGVPALGLILRRRHLMRRAK